MLLSGNTYSSQSHSSLQFTKLVQFLISPQYCGLCFWLQESFPCSVQQTRVFVQEVPGGISTSPASEISSHKYFSMKVCFFNLPSIIITYYLMCKATWILFKSFADSKIYNGNVKLCISKDLVTHIRIALKHSRPRLRSQIRVDCYKPQPDKWKKRQLTVTFQGVKEMHEAISCWVCLLVFLLIFHNCFKFNSSKWILPSW